MATSLHPPYCSSRLPTDDNITHLDEDVKCAAFRFITVTEILNALIPLRLEPITALKPALMFNPYPTAFPYGNGMLLHFYQQQESSTTKTVHKVINKGLKAYVQSPQTGENFH